MKPYPVSAPAGLCVLVADDDHGVRTTIGQILGDAGYCVIEAEDGEAALQQLQRHPVAVLLLDIRMPKRDGIAVLDALSRPPVVLLVSAFSVDNQTRDRIGSKVHRYLQKPVAPLHLLECVAEAAEIAMASDRGSRALSAGE